MNLTKVMTYWFGWHDSYEHAEISLMIGNQLIMFTKLFGNLNVVHRNNVSKQFATLFVPKLEVSLLSVNQLIAI